MEIEKHEYIHLKMNRQEAEQLLTMIDQLGHTVSNFPDWIKERAKKFSLDMRKAGLG